MCMRFLFIVSLGFRVQSLGVKPTVYMKLIFIVS
jgi:hypothetical protein